MPPYLPREGLTLEAAFVPLTLTFLEPLFTGSLLCGILYWPRQVHSILPVQLHRYATSEVFISSLKFLVGFGMVRRVNKILSRLTLNNFTTDSWKGRAEVVVVTGAAGGIGRAIVDETAKTAGTVIALDLNPPSKSLPINAYFYKVDLSKAEEIHAVAEAIRKEHGDPTVLVNNAGIAVGRPILSETEEQLHRIFNVNTISHFLLAKEFLPAMIKDDHGHVVTVASVGSFTVQAQNVDYNCTKASALAFHEGLAQELKYRYNAPKVRTTVVHPGYVRTPMLADNLAEPSFDKFVVEPETIADAVATQLQSCQSAQLILPARFTFVSGIRGWPSWVQETIRNSLSDELRFLGSQGKSFPGRSD